MPVLNRPPHLNPLPGDHLAWRVARVLSPRLVPFLLSMVVLAFVAGLSTFGCGAEPELATEAQESTSTLVDPAVAAPLGGDMGLGMAPVVAAEASTEATVPDPAQNSPELDAVDWAPTLVPPGFEPEDRFENAQEACLTLVEERVPESMRRGVFDLCEHRTWNSSRYKVVKSKVDASWVHDRDRPVAWKFYARGIHNGSLNPGKCVHHRFDDSGRPEKSHPPSEKKLIANWPFKRPTMTDQLRKTWQHHHHDQERFGTRGPHDNNMALLARMFPGCYPPEVLDRYDVNVTVTVDRAVEICESWGMRCTSKAPIKKKWRVGTKPGWKR